MTGASSAFVVELRASAGPRDRLGHGDHLGATITGRRGPFRDPAAHRRHAARGPSGPIGAHWLAMKRVVGAVAAIDDGGDMEVCAAHGSVSSGWRGLGFSPFENADRRSGAAAVGADPRCPAPVGNSGAAAPELPNGG